MIIILFRLMVNTVQDGLAGHVLGCLKKTTENNFQ